MILLSPFPYRSSFRFHELHTFFEKKIEAPRENIPRAMKFVMQRPHGQACKRHVPRKNLNLAPCGLCKGFLAPSVLILFSVSVTLTSVAANNLFMTKSKTYYPSPPPLRPSHMVVSIYIPRDSVEVARFFLLLDALPYANLHSRTG